MTRKISFVQVSTHRQERRGEELICYRHSETERSMSALPPSALKRELAETRRHLVTQCGPHRDELWEAFLEGASAGGSPTLTACGR